VTGMRMGLERDWVLQPSGHCHHHLTMTKAYDEIVEFIAAGSTPASLLSFQASEESRQRVHELIQKEKSDGLLPEETTELNDCLQLEHLMRMAKARARARVGQ